MPIERTFRLTKDDLLEVKLDAIGEFVEWLHNEKGITLGVPVGALDEFFRADTSAFGRKRIMEQTRSGMSHSWSQQQDFDSSVTAEPMDTMPQEATLSSTVES